MNNSARTRSFRSAALAALLLAGSGSAWTQVPVDDAGKVVGDYQPAGSTGEEGIPLRSETELQDLVGPIALYPDDLLAIVLPAATFPLQVVQAARFLEDLEDDASLQPDGDWDDSIVALVNYPEVVELLNDDLEWTWELGEAVVAQQGDVLDAVANFRERAYAAGNLKSDEHQKVVRNEEIIEIEPVSEEVIYVPYYEPERVVVYQSRPVYRYYPRAYPVYYYPYPTSYAFGSGYFWGLTTAFSIGWASNNLSVYHHSYYGHPYYGYSYWDRWWYRRPSVSVYNNYYVSNNYYNNRYDSSHRYTHGDAWRPRGYTRLRYSDQRITRNRYYPNPATATGSNASRQARISSQGNRQVAAPNSQRQVSRDRAAGSVTDMRNAIDSNVRLRASGNKRQTNGSRPATRERSGNSDMNTNSVREMRNALVANRETRVTSRQPGIAQSRETLVTPRTTVPEARTNIVRPRESLQRSTQPATRQPVSQSQRQVPATAYKAPEQRSSRAASNPSPRRSTPERSTSTRSERTRSNGSGQSRSASGGFSERTGARPRTR